MDITRSEEEQLEALKKWWGENSKSVIGGIIIGFGAIFGWRSWHTYQLEQAAAASDLYASMIVEVRQQKNDTARKLATKLRDEYTRTTYAGFASIILAKLDVDADDLEAAGKNLQWVLDHTDQDELKHLARLRLARVLLDAGKPEQSLELVSVKDQGEFAASYAELKGDIYMQLGQPEQARTAYQLALAGMDESAKTNSFLQLKIDDMGPSDQE